MYVLIRHLPFTMNAGKACAQACHAGTHMASMYKNHPDVKGFLSMEENVGIGTTIVLKAKKVYHTEDQIRRLVAIAASHGMVCGVIEDPTYPVDHELTTNILTAGYILLDKRNKYMLPLLEQWELY